MVPKVDSVAALDDIACRLDAGGATDDVDLGNDRDANGDLRRRAIAAHPRVSALVIGTNDLARELRAPLNLAGRRTSTPHLATAVLAARAAGKLIVDGVFNDVGDIEGFVAECRQGVEMGFDGKTLDPPRPGRSGQRGVDAVGRRDRAGSSCDRCLHRRKAEGRGVATVDGRMVEALHVDTARRTLAIADAIPPTG